MNIKRKLTIALSAQQFLERAIVSMQAGESDTLYDYDLWRTFKDLKSIQDDDDAINGKPQINKSLTGE